MTRRLNVVLFGFIVLGLVGCDPAPGIVERPEQIVSKRIVVYDQETYRSLAELWKSYHAAFPSEDAYANWMYAARYAGAEDYESLLKRGRDRYPANPVLMYLEAMLHHGATANIEAQELLERAVELDPSYLDPWFSLVVHYLERGEEEKTRIALRRLLEQGAIGNEVIDYSYNMIIALEKDAILVTNGDNDTYPGWMLTRVLGIRPDVRIVNRALLNTEWYPLSVIADGVPAFTDQQKLADLRKRLWAELKAGEKAMPPAGPYADALIELLVEAGNRSGRPVYFATTLTPSTVIDRLKGIGRGLGLVTLVTTPAASERTQVRNVFETWVKRFRTAGMDAWDVQNSDGKQAGRRLMANYAGVLKDQMDAVIRFAPDLRLELFRWYRDHAMVFVPTAWADSMHRAWCRSDDLKEIRAWCRSMNIQ